MRSLILTTFLLLAACTPKPTETNGSPTTPAGSTDIFGEWDWIRTSGGFAGEIILPTPGVWQTYRFTSDSIAEFSRRNGKTVESWSSSFSLQHQRSITGKVAPFLLFKDSAGSHGIPQSVWFHGKDTLELLDEAADGYSYLYVRK